MFVGEKLTNMRLLHGFSRQELANNLGITEQAVWQYENGYTTPGLETINKMRKLFNIKAKFLYSPDFITNQIAENNIAYRASERSSRKKAKAESIHLEYLNVMLDFIEKYIAYPPNLLIEIRNESINLQNENEKKGIPKEKTIEQISLLTRERIGLNKEDNEDFLFLLEKSGAFIFEKALGEEVDAYSVWSNQDRPFIMLSNIKKSSSRRNFDLAHELGHLILHHRIDIFELEPKEFEQVEKEANLFASNFLLPGKEYLRDLKHIQRKSNPKSYIDLKKKWNVSIAAMGRRAYSFREIDYQQYRYFNALLNKYEFKHKEPLDDELVIMRPGKIRHSLKFVLEKKLCSISDIINHTNFEVELLSYLFNIEEEFFNKYLTEPKVYEFTPKF
ncbi:ImmA/IrrE family metallo-endopeptidase [Priestia aryabhattai]|uniref:spr1629 family repressor/antitoxin n=1 Tax=Priestia aryabhattai TaxID=412384 RepID=UPI003981A9A3